MMMSPAAFQLHSLCTAVSAVRGRAGFVLDEYLASLTEADLDSRGDDPTFLAAELCAVGVWEPVAGGYRVLDPEAVQVCADRVRELKEEDAKRMSGPGPGLSDREPAAVGVAGTTRFGDRTRRGTAASFRCAQCGEIAGVVRVARAGNPDDLGWASGTGLAASGLVLDCFLGSSWHAQEAGILDGVQALIERGNVDAAAIRKVSWTLWDVTPFFCPECELNSCSTDWDTYVDFNVGFWDCHLGICPNGHRHLVG
jgi:hypothetical protein